MSEFTIAVVVFLILYTIRKSKNDLLKIKEESKEDLEHQLELIEEYSWEEKGKYDFTTYTINFSKMTFTHYHVLDECCLDETYILNQRNGIWYMALTQRRSGITGKDLEVINSKMTSNFLSEHPADHVNYDFVASTEKAIAGFPVNDPVLLNTLNEQLNIYNEKKSAWLRKIS